MTTGHKTQLKGYRLKDGKLVEDEKRFNICKQLTRRSSKKVRPARKGETAAKT